MKLSLLCLAILPVADAFTTPTLSHTKVSAGVERIQYGSRIFAKIPDQDQEQNQIVEEPSKDSNLASSISALSATLCLLSSDVANAAGPDWGKIPRRPDVLYPSALLFRIQFSHILPELIHNH